jgi:YgiT-type zinc finger domain-containing protein
MEAGVRGEERPLTCVVCKAGETRKGTAAITPERGGTVVVFRRVPAVVCEVCGEEYVDEETTARLSMHAEEAVRAGVQVDVREYVAL